MFLVPDKKSQRGHFSLVKILFLKFTTDNINIKQVATIRKKERGR
jgi:hypothetical protein